MNSASENLVIIGSGPAGLTAAIYAARGNLNPLVVSGRQAGGQLTLTTDVDDFPGFEQGIQGPELMEKMRRQAVRFKARFIDEDVTAVDLKQRPFQIQTETKTLFAQSVIIATGASAKWLGLESERRLIGRGVSACAVCDGLFFKDKDVVVVGGGDSAMRESQHLSKICRSVTVIHRRSELKAQKALQDLIRSKPNVRFLFNSVVEEILGTEKVIGVRVKNTASGEVGEMKIDGVFVAIGHAPNTSFLRGQLEMDELGYLIVKDHTKTSVAGVFAAGDVSDYRYRQAVTAAGAGCMAALDAEEYLETAKILK